MNTRTSGLLQIILGSAILIIFGGELIFRLFFVAIGLYLIYTGMRIRNPNTIIFSNMQFGNKNWPF